MFLGSDGSNVCVLIMYVIHMQCYIAVLHSVFYSDIYLLFLFLVCCLTNSVIIQIFANDVRNGYCCPLVVKFDKSVIHALGYQNLKMCKVKLFYHWNVGYIIKSQKYKFASTDDCQDSYSQIHKVKPQHVSIGQLYYIQVLTFQ